MIFCFWIMFSQSRRSRPVTAHGARRYRWRRRFVWSDRQMYDLQSSLFSFILDFRVPLHWFRVVLLEIRFFTNSELYTLSLSLKLWIIIFCKVRMISFSVWLCLRVDASNSLVSILNEICFAFVRIAEVWFTVYRFVYDGRTWISSAYEVAFSLFGLNFE